MEKKPRQMSIEEYYGSVMHTHTWFNPEQVLPPSNENVIVETKESLSKQCAYYVDDPDAINGAVFFGKDNRPLDEIEKGFYIECPNKGPIITYKEITVTMWTDLPSMGTGAEILNAALYLRRTFEQLGRSEETLKKIDRVVRSIYEEKVVPWKMTNLEYYRHEIAECIDEGVGWGVINGHPKACGPILCLECIAYKSELKEDETVCDTEKIIDWMLAEHKEEKDAEH